jgi:hypothetical protein
MSWNPEIEELQRRQGLEMSRAERLALGKGRIE